MTEKTDSVRAKIAEDMKAFYAKGGKVTQVDHTNNKGWFIPPPRNARSRAKKVDAKPGVKK